MSNPLGTGLPELDRLLRGLIAGDNVVWRVDRIEDFGAGDRVRIEDSTAYTLSQVGADTVISLSSGDKMILVGVQQAALPAGWIFSG